MKLTLTTDPVVLLVKLTLTTDPVVLLVKLTFTTDPVVLLVKLTLTTDPVVSQSLRQDPANTTATCICIIIDICQLFSGMQVGVSLAKCNAV